MAGRTPTRPARHQRSAWRVWRRRHDRPLPDGRHEACRFTLRFGETRDTDAELSVVAAARLLREFL